MPKISEIPGKRATPQLVADAPNGAERSLWDEVDTIRMLLYGRSGTGKTTLWATFPGPILALICSGGNKPGELRSINTPEYRKKIKPVAVQSTDDFRQRLEESSNFATVVLDHASGYADVVLKEILGLSELPAQKGWGLASQQQYGQQSLQCKESFRALLNLSANVVIVAQERVFGDDNSSDAIKPTVGAALTPSVTGWLNPACDFVVQTYIRPRYTTKTVTIGGQKMTEKVKTEKKEYCLRTEPHETFMTKFRIPRGMELPECIVDPSYDKIMALINGAR